MGWADFRLTQYQDIEKWWEIVFSAYLLVSLFTETWKNFEKYAAVGSVCNARERWAEHPR